MEVQLSISWSTYPGICSGFFSSSELLVMSSKLLQGKLKITRDGAQQAFARSVRKNLHVLVVWSLDSKSSSPFEVTSVRPKAAGDLERVMETSQPLLSQQQWNYEQSMRAIFVSLCRSCSHIDHYHPWSKQVYGDIALRWWQEASQTNWQEWADTG